MNKKNMNITQIKKKAEAWADKYLDKVAIYNKSFGNYIEITKNGIDHTLRSKPINEALILSIYELKDILYYCKYSHSEPPRHNQPNVIKIHKFAMNKVIKDVKYRIEIIVREVKVNAKEKNKNYFYDHTVIEKV